MALNSMERQEWKERTVDIWAAHKLLEQQRQTIDPYQSTPHGAMFDAIVAAQAILEKYLMPGQ